MKTLILIVIMVLTGWALGAQDWGGRYFMVESEDGSAPEYRAAGIYAGQWYRFVY